MKYSGYNILEQGLIIGSITARMEEKGELNSYDFESNYYTAAKQIIAEYEKNKGLEYFSVFVERRIREMQAVKEGVCEDNQFTFYDVEINDRGAYKGYITGMIKFAGRDRLHAFIYRMSAEDGSEGNKLISIDDAYKNPLIVEIWENIESQIYKKYCIIS